METIINAVIIGFTILVTLYVEIFMYRKPITAKEIDDCRKDHERSAKAIKEAYNIDVPKADAETEILKSRKQNRTFVLLLSGACMAFVLIGLSIFHLLTFATITIICSSGIILMCYGIIRVAESKLLAIGILTFVFIMGIIMITIFNKLVTTSPFAYFYMCGFIAVLAILTFIPRVQKFAKSH